MSDFIVINARSNFYNVDTKKSCDKYVDFLSKIQVLGTDTFIELSLFDSTKDNSKCSLSRFLSGIDETVPTSVKISLGTSSLYELRDQIDLALLKSKKLKENEVLKV